MSVADLLVDVPPNLEDIKPGWVAVVVILLLIVVTALLWLNMRKHLGRISCQMMNPHPCPRGAMSKATGSKARWSTMSEVIGSGR